MFMVSGVGGLGSGALNLFLFSCCCNGCCCCCYCCCWYYYCFSYQINNVVVSFLQEAFDLTTYSSGEAVVEAIGQLRHMAGNRTETFKGIDYMREHQLAEGIVRPGLRKVGVVITDGASHEYVDL